MNGKILFVDDEPEALAAFQRILHRDFALNTALSGEAAISEVIQNGPYDVVVSDMRMPGMDGIQVLSQVREISPQTVRVMLTGHADLESAINAVNEGAVFRFLTKPCPADVLKKTLTACLMQYRLVTAEKELLENTLMGAIKVLTDVLSLANPAAFGRSLRINHYVKHMVRELRLEVPWKYEAAAMLSQLGCITLEPELLEAYTSQTLTPEEQVHFNMHPSVGRDLLINIPRLEGIAWIVGQQFGAAAEASKAADSLQTGAQILQVAVAFDRLKTLGRSQDDAIGELQASRKFDSQIVGTLETLPATISDTSPEAVEISRLQAGMIVAEDIRSNIGFLLAGKGQEINHPLIVRLSNFRRRQLIKDQVLVFLRKDPGKPERAQAASI